MDYDVKFTARNLLLLLLLNTSCTMFDYVTQYANSESQLSDTLSFCLTHF